MFLIIEREKTLQISASSPRNWKHMHGKNPDTSSRIIEEDWS